MPVLPTLSFRVAQRLSRPYPRPFRGGAHGPCWVRVGGRLTRAVVDDTATPLSVRQTNLDFVTSVLTAARIWHVVVPSHPGVRSRVAVRARDGGAALTRLRRAAPATQMRVAVPRPGSAPAGVVWVYRAVCTSGRDLVYGPAYGCDVELWHEDGTVLAGPRPDAAWSVLPWSDDEVSWVHGGRLSAFVPSGLPRLYPTHPVIARRPGAVSVPADALIEWSDPEALRYALRSLHLNAPWVRRVYVISDGYLPPWLVPAHPRLTVVSAWTPWPDRPPGMAPHVLRLRDGTYAGRPLTPVDLFTGVGASGRPRIRHLDVRLGDRRTPLRLNRLLNRRDRHTFRLVGVGDPLAAAFLARYFPVPSPFELPVRPFAQLDPPVAPTAVPVIPVIPVDPAHPVKTGAS